MISKKISFRSPFPDISTYANSVRIARCYESKVHQQFFILSVFNQRSVKNMYFKAGSRNFAFVVVSALLVGCTTIDTKPFEQFNSSLTELNKGAISSLDVTIPLAEGRYRKKSRVN